MQLQAVERGQNPMGMDVSGTDRSKHKRHDDADGNRYCLSHSGLSGGAACCGAIGLSRGLFCCNAASGGVVDPGSLIFPPFSENGDVCRGKLGFFTAVRRLFAMPFHADCKASIFPATIWLQWLAKARHILRSSIERAGLPGNLCSNCVQMRFGRDGGNAVFANA